MNFAGDSIPRLLLKMAAPASIGFFFNTMFNVVDTYWGGQLSTETLAALSLSFPMFFSIVATGYRFGYCVNPGNYVLFLYSFVLMQLQVAAD